METHGIAISLFSGAGGLDLGAEQAGYRGARLPSSGTATPPTTMEKNFSHLVSPVIQNDILDTPTREILPAAGLASCQRPDLLIGGPPCTPFSKSGFWLEWKREGLDPDASLLQAYTRVLAEAQPRSVRARKRLRSDLQQQGQPPALRAPAARDRRGRIPLPCAVLNAADYGVPQARPRLFVIGAPKDEPCPVTLLRPRRQLGTPDQRRPGRHMSQLGEALPRA